MKDPLAEHYEHGEKFNFDPLQAWTLWTNGIELKYWNSFTFKLAK